MIEHLWAGKTGIPYKYFVTDINSLLAVPANYALVKQLSDGTRVPLYFGEAVNLTQRMSGHEKLAEARRLGMNLFMTHTASSDKTIRCAEESDLIARWNPPLNIQYRRLATLLTG